MLGFFHFNHDVHGGRRDNTAQALAQWQRLVASREATVVLHGAMLIALYRPGGMVIKIAVELVFLLTSEIRVQLEKKIFLPHFYDLAKSLQPRSHPTPCLHLLHAGLGKSKKLTLLEAVKAHHGGVVFVVCCVLCLNLITDFYMENLWGKRFLFPPEPL